MDVNFDQIENSTLEDVWQQRLVAVCLKRWRDKHGLAIDRNTPFGIYLILICSYYLHLFPLFYSFSCRLMPCTQKSLEPGLTMPRNTAMLITSGSAMQYTCTNISFLCILI